MTTVVSLYESLIILFEKTRDNFDHFETEAKEISKITEYEKDTKRNRKESLYRTNQDHLR